MTKSTLYFPSFEVYHIITCLSIFFRIYFVNLSYNVAFLSNFSLCPTQSATKNRRNIIPSVIITTVFCSRQKPLPFCNQTHSLCRYALAVTLRIELLICFCLYGYIVNIRFESFCNVFAHQVYVRRHFRRLYDYI